MTDTTQLEDGFYWVRYRAWQIARYCELGDCFRIAGHNAAVLRSHLDEIDPRPIKREEPGAGAYKTAKAAMDAEIMKEAGA